ncbi:MAG: outer membrane protein assembly factor BamD [Campylobacterales bacterium]
MGWKAVLRVGLGIGLIGVIGFTGCSGKKGGIGEYSPLELHRQIKRAILKGNLDEADDLYLQLISQYPGSPYLESDSLSLALAHSREGEYQLGKEYLKEYLRKFADLNGEMWGGYLQIKWDFESYTNPYTNQQLLLQILQEAEAYLDQHPNSPFRYEVETIYYKTLLTNLLLQQQIAKLYRQMGDKNSSLAEKLEIPGKFIPPKLPLYKRLFNW